MFFDDVSLRLSESFSLLEQAQHLLREGTSPQAGWPGPSDLTPLSRPKGHPPPGGGGLKPRWRSRHAGPVVRNRDCLLLEQAQHLLRELVGLVGRTM